MDQLTLIFNIRAIKKTIDEAKMVKASEFQNIANLLLRER